MSALTTSSILEPLLRPELAELSPYTPHSGTFAVRLDANEAPPFLSRDARRRLGEAAVDIAWERYPDVAMTELKTAIAARSGVTPEEVLIGVGSDEVITMLLTALSRPRGTADSAIVLTTSPTFVMYRLSARVRGQRVLEVPLDDSWDLSETGLSAALRVAEPSVIFIASPNNPTGNRMSMERLSALIDAAKRSLVVIDEAYIDYADQNHLDLYRRSPNVAILRTLSKIGFAALRVGWIIGRPELIRELDKVRQPYNQSTVSQRLATVALTELGGEVQHGIDTVVRERARLTERLSGLPGVAVTNSQANFLWVRSERTAEAVFNGLSEQGVLVRSFHARGGRLTHSIRVTIGTQSENDAFFDAFRKLV